MLIVYSCQNFCNINKRLLYYVSVTRVRRTVLNSRVDSGGCVTGHCKGRSPAPPRGTAFPRGETKAEAWQLLAV